jgi:outer membrane protein assembly factor BamD (BamD/ComL family)
MNGKFLKRLFLLIITSGILIFSACTGNQAQELYKTAEFEELQKNQEHAIQLYEEIIEKHPDSEFAQKARIRLSELE